MYYHVKFGSSALGSTGFRPLAAEAWMTPRNTLLPTCVALSNLVALGQTVRALVGKSALKYNPSRLRFQGHSRLSELTCIDPQLDFLLTCHSNHGPISYRFRCKRRFQSKIKIFTPCVFKAPAEGVPLWIGFTSNGLKKLEWCNYQTKKRSLKISLAV